MIYSRLSKFLIFEKELFGKFNSEEKYEQAHYNLQIILINIEKLLFVYTFSFFLSTTLNTFFMHLAYFVLRKYAGGWHAKKSINCTLFSSFSFVAIPWIFNKINYSFTATTIWLMTITIFLILILYAPADTEKNPLVSISERMKMKMKATLVAVISLLVVFFVNNETIQFNILSGIILECITIHPVFYKITKRSYKNYEKYESIE